MLATTVTTNLRPQSACCVADFTFSRLLVCAVSLNQLLRQEQDAEGEEERGLLKGNLFLLSLCWVKRK